MQTNLSATDITLIIAAIGTLFATALVPGSILIVKSVKEAVKEVIEAMKLQNVTLDSIHKLTNSQHTTSLQLVADSAKKTAETTGDPEDIILSESAQKALLLAQEATKSEDKFDATKIKSE